MNIYSPPETLVVFNQPIAGYQSDIDKAAKYLIVGNTYTVEYTDVGNWSTGVYLQEVPGVRFNSCHFIRSESSLEERNGL